MRLGRFAILVAFGAIGGTLLDALHTFSGTSEYPQPFVCRTAWWVPLLFANAYGVGGWLYARAYRRMHGPRDVRSWSTVTFGVVVFACLYAASAFLPLANLWKLAVLGAGAGALWFWFDRSWQCAALSAVTAILGPTTEILLSRAGVFRHLQPDWLGIPMWLPALYFAAGPSFGQFARRVLRAPRAPALVTS
jgi:hypothetical protein